jgi:hypothetical protein
MLLLLRLPRLGEIKQGLTYLVKITLKLALVVLTLAALGLRAPQRNFLRAFAHLRHFPHFNCTF